MCKIGNKTKDLGWTLDHGSLDWKNVSMACREFVSNAMDRCTKEGTKPNITLVEDKSVRAKDGFTRIFLGFEGGIVTFYSELNKRFLNVEGKTPLGVLPKAARNISGGMSKSGESGTASKRGRRPATRRGRSLSVSTGTTRSMVCTLYA
jgi:hypothetical protein